MSLAARVARRFLAEALTKSWLMGVRRGWLSLLHPSINDFDDALGADTKLIEFVSNLKDQVLFERRARSIDFLSTTGDPEFKSLMAWFAKLDTALKEHRSSVQHWQEVASGELESRGVPQSDGEHMLNVYRTKFYETLTTHVKTKVDPKKNKWQSTREAHVTEVLDKILAILYKWAAVQKEVGETFEEAFKEFAIGDMKVIVVDPESNGALINKYVSLAIEAKRALESKRLGKVWTGLTLLRSSDYRKLSEGEKQRYEDAGYEDLSSVAGLFYEGKNFVELTAPPNARLIKTIVHELGHRYWFKNMSPDQRARFQGVTRTKAGPEGGNKKKQLAEARGWLKLLEGQLKQFAEVARFDGSSLEANQARTPWGWLEEFQEKSETIINQTAKTLMTWRHPDSGPGLRVQFMRAMKAANKLSWLYKATSRLKPLIPVLENVHRYGPDKNIDNNDFVRAQVKFGKQGEILVQRLREEIEAYFEEVPGGVPAVSDYGRTDPAEAFAEAFAHYVLERDMTRDQMESFRSVLSRQKHYRYDDSQLKRLNDPSRREETMRNDGGYYVWRIEIVPIKDIRVPPRWQPQRYEKAKALIEKGVPIDPIRADKSGSKWEISDGIHRTTASIDLGYTHVPVLTSAWIETPEAMAQEPPEKPELPLGAWVKLHEPFEGKQFAWVREKLGARTLRYRGVKRHHYGLAVVGPEDTWPDLGDFFDTAFEPVTPPPWGPEVKARVEQRSAV